MFRVFFLLLITVFLTPTPRPAQAQTSRVADKATIGQVMHFTLEAEETKDIAIALPKGDYVIQADLKLVEAESSNIIMRVDLLKSNGVLVQERVLGSNETHRVARVAAPLRMAKPLGARLRVKNNTKPMEYWIAVYPAAKRAFVPFAFGGGDVQPLGIGEEAGKGGRLTKSPEDGFYTFHKIMLPAGKYDISLYLKLDEKESTNLMGSLLLLDKFGVPDKRDWILNVNENGNEVRKDKRLVLTKPTPLYFMVTNSNYSREYDYTVGIEKATD